MTGFETRSLLSFGFHFLCKKSSPFLFSALMLSHFGSASAQAPVTIPTPTPTDGAISPGDGPIRSAKTACTDANIRFIEADVAQPYPQFPVGGEPILDPKGAARGKREVTVHFACHGDGGFTLPTITSLHFLEVNNGQICHTVRSCGNLKHIGGYFGVSLGWSEFTSVGKYIVSKDYVRQTVNYDGLSIQLSAYVSFDQFERYCSAPSSTLCL
jgi:hypothetical protein